MKFGVYQCVGCDKSYIVNDGTWRSCTPDFCHDCCESHEQAEREHLGDPDKKTGIYAPTV